MDRGINYHLHTFLFLMSCIFYKKYPYASVETRPTGARSQHDDKQDI